MNTRNFILNKGDSSILSQVSQSLAFYKRVHIAENVQANYYTTLREKLLTDAIHESITR